MNKTLNLKVDKTIICDQSPNPSLLPQINLQVISENAFTASAQTSPPSKILLKDKQMLKTDLDKSKFENDVLRSKVKHVNSEGSILKSINEESQVRITQKLINLSPNNYDSKLSRKYYESSKIIRTPLKLP
jgi:hypothetical protein